MSTSPSIKYVNCGNLLVCATFGRERERERRKETLVLYSWGDNLSGESPHSDFPLLIPSTKLKKINDVRD